ncbi:MAG: hypothetical protein NTX25_03595, partial [Proteobacteria bacterium]|nr:hypothetical protein [Pseudomonadota bacterium]
MLTKWKLHKMTFFKISFFALYAVLLFSCSENPEQNDLNIIDEVSSKEVENTAIDKALPKDEDGGDTDKDKELILTLRNNMTTTSLISIDENGYYVDDDGIFEVSGHCETGSRVKILLIKEAAPKITQEDVSVVIDCVDEKYSNKITINRKSKILV